MFTIAQPGPYDPTPGTSSQHLLGHVGCAGGVAASPLAKKKIRQSVSSVSETLTAGRVHAAVQDGGKPKPRDLTGGRGAPNFTPVRPSSCCCCVELTTLLAHDMLTLLRAERSVVVHGSMADVAEEGCTLKPHVRMSDESVLNPNHATGALGSALSLPWTTCSAAGTHTHHGMLIYPLSDIDIVCLQTNYSFTHMCVYVHNHSASGARAAWSVAYWYAFKLAQFPCNIVGKSGACAAQ